MPGLRKPICLRLNPAEFSEVQDDIFGRRWIKFNELFFLIIGLILVTLGVLFFLGINPLPGKGSGWGFIIVGGPWSVLVAAKVGLRAWMSRLVPQDSVYDHIGYQSLNRSLAENKVQP